MPSIAGVVGLVMLSSSHGLAQEIDFAHQVMPILQQHCARCHTGEKKKGGFSMNTRESLLAGGEGGAVLISGQSAQSRLLKLVRETNPDDRMPPGDKPLSAGEIEVLRKWIDAGVPWTPGFAFNKAAYEPPLRPRRPELPRRP